MRIAPALWSAHDLPRSGDVRSAPVRRLHAASAGVAALALVLSACGGLGGGGAADSDPAEIGPEANSAEMALAGAVEIEVGTHYDDIRATVPGFPEQSAGVSEGTNTVITYAGHDYVFDSDGVVVEVRPHDGSSGGARETSEASAADGGSGTATVKSGETELVTYRPYLDGGLLAPGFQVRDELQFPWACQDSPEGFLTCGQERTDMAVEYCSTDGEYVWCPDYQGSGEPSFVRAMYGGSNPASSPSRPDAGPLPVYVDLSDGQRCRFGIVPGNPNPNAEHFYSCDDYERLWAENGEAMFTTNGTWAALKANIGSSQLRPVQVVRAVFFE